MNRVRAFFVEEATECLGALRSALTSEVPDRDALYAAARRLRGSAQVARFGGVAEEAEALERTLRDAASGPLDGAVTGPESAGDEVVTGVVPIDTLEYRGAAALEQAGSLRKPLEDAIIEGDPPGGILDELFDLIRLGTK